MNMEGIDPQMWQAGTAEKRYSTETVLEQGYLFSIATFLLGPDSSSSTGLDLSPAEVVSLYNRFRRDAGLISTPLYAKAESLVGRIEPWNLAGEAGFFSTQTDESLLKICTMDFNEQTYKSREICHEIDLDAL